MGDLADREIVFSSQFDWAICPVKPHELDPKLPKQPDSMDFRWKSFDRVSGVCGPYQIGSRMGWYLLSPVDVTLRPFTDFCFSCPEEELARAIKDMGLQEVWLREKCYIGVQENLGLKLFDFWENGNTQTMFLPNGEGSLEWKIGVNVRLPETASLFIQDAGSDGFTTLPGVIGAKTVQSNFLNRGMSIAVRPNRTTTIRRGDVIGRLLVFDEQSLQMNLRGATLQ